MPTLFVKMIYLISIVILALSVNIYALPDDTESICFHSNMVSNPSTPPVRGPVGKAGPIGPTGPPGIPGKDAVCNYDTAEFDALKEKINELERKYRVIII